MDEARLIERLRAGDERAFEALVARHQRTMLAVARNYVSSRAVAEEVVQEAWLAVIRGLDGFEGRSSLATWIMRIVANLARTRGAREARIVPFEPSVDPGRFRGAGDPYPGHWWAPPSEWPEDVLSARETLAVVLEEIERLPPAQRSVIAMRDIQGLSAEEVRDVLEISDGNQRVLLHRARSRVRAALERHFDEQRNAVPAAETEQG